MADELDDDFVQSDVGSDQELDVKEKGTIPTKQFKRKATNNDGEDSEEDEASFNPNDADENKKRKKQKMKKRDQIKKQKKAMANMALEPGVLAKFPIEMQTDHLRLLMKSCKPYAKLTELELDQIGIQQSMLIDRGDVKTTKATDKEDALILLLEKSIPKLRQMIDNQIKEGIKGQPSILVITGNAQRAADLTRPLRSLHPKQQASSASKGSKGSKDSKDSKDSFKSVAVAKLFARHFKIEEQKIFLQSHICPLAVGTPQRIQDLLNNGLSLESLFCIILDVSWLDQKQRTMLDTIETRQALFSMLASDQFQTRLRGKGGKEEKKKKVVEERARILLF